MNAVAGLPDPNRSQVITSLTETNPTRFGDLPTAGVPPTTGLYTFWLDDQFLYVGISYRDPATTTNPQARGILGRLTTYYRGRRTGDLPLAICDRYVVPDLSTDQLEGLRTGATKLDDLTRQFMHDRLTIRWATCTGDDARAIEHQIRSSGLPGHGPPLLNPLGATP